jgi:hypothetical protein
MEGLNMVLDYVIGVKEASEKWGLSEGYIKNLCAKGDIVCKKIGKTWVIDATQTCPKAGSAHTKETKTIQNVYAHCFTCDDLTTHDVTQKINQRSSKVTLAYHCKTFKLYDATD